jgi:hypothetical protein
LEQRAEGLAFEHDDSASDGSSGDGSVHSAEDRLSGEDSDKELQDHVGDAALEPRVGPAATHDSHESHSQESSSPKAASSSAAVQRVPSGAAAGEGWDNLSPFGDVDAAAAASAGGSGEGRIGLLPLDGLLFHDSPMYEHSLQVFASHYV